MLSRAFWGRTDLPSYAAGARTLRNFTVTPGGSITNRTGTQHVATLINDAGALITDARLFPFVFDNDDVGMLLFTNGRRVYMWQRSSSSPRHAWTRTTLTVLTPYTGSLETLRFSQSGNVVTITSEAYDPYKLTRDPDDGSWSMTAVSFDVPNFTPVPGEPYPRLGLANPSNGFSGNASHPARPWQWAVTRIIRRDDGTVYETAPYVITDSLVSGSVGTVPDDVAVYSDWQMRVLLYGEQYDDAGDGVIQSSRVYRGREGRFGLLGETKGDDYIDDGADPDFSDPPPQEVNPFKVYSAGGGLLRTEKPIASTIFENRRIFGGTEQRPGTGWGSAIGQWENFDEVPFADDEDSFRFELASSRTEKIRAFVEVQNQLLAFTSASVRRLAGSGESEVVTPNSLAARKLSSSGCAIDVSPLLVGERVFFMGGKAVRPLVLVFSANGAQSMDMSLASRDLFDGHTIVDWAYAEDPHSIIWVVRSDGALLSLTYLPELEVMAWALHEVSGDGLVESVATMPEGTEDAVYLIVNRDGTRSLERMAYRNLPLRTIDDEDLWDVRYAIYMDRAVSYSGWRTATGVEWDFSIADGGSGSEVGDTVVLTFDGDEELFDSKVGRVIHFDDPDGGAPYRLLVTSRLGGGSGQYQAQVIERDIPSTMLGVTYEGDEWAYAVTSLNGLEHLDGQTVVVLAEGNVYRDLVVAGGSVDVGEYFSIGHAGLSYNADFESLDAVQDKQRQKSIREVFIELVDSRGGFAGPTLDDLTEIEYRDPDDAYNVLPLKTFMAPLSIADDWDTACRCAFRQSDPLPVTIVGITRDIVVGGPA